MRLLVDTCVISEVQKPNGNATVRAAFEQTNPYDLFLSVITLGELTRGVLLLPPGQKKRKLSAWLLSLENAFGDRILSLDLEAAHLWGEITAHAQAGGIVVPASDGLIAATALRHGLHVMTRNVRHFAATGVPVLNPWE